MYVRECFRYGSGYTLQAKINPAVVTPDNILRESPLFPVANEPPAVSKRPNVATSHNEQSEVAPLSRADVMVDTTGLKHFIEQSFHGARLVEEHQVCVHHINTVE